MTEVLILSSDDVEPLARPEEYVGAVQDAYRQRGEGGGASLPATLHNDAGSGAIVSSYTAILPETEIMGGYTFSHAGDAWCVAALFDATDGELLALVDGAYMNHLKAGAAATVAVDELARSDASTVGVIGSGVQAIGQLRTLPAVRDLDDVRIYSRTAAHRDSTAAVLDDALEATVRAVQSSSAAVEGADIVVTATTAADPVFSQGDLAEGAHVNAIGAHGPDAYEVPPAVAAEATYVIDHRDRVAASGLFQAALAADLITETHLHAELGDLVAGTRPGRVSPADTTLFDSAGTGIETLGAANMLYERALERDLGTTVSLSSIDQAVETW